MREHEADQNERAREPTDKHLHFHRLIGYFNQSSVIYKDPAINAARSHF
jgi:hypothetical protein